MKTTLIVGGCVILALVFLGVGSYISNANYGNRAEVSIKAEYENMQNVLGQYSLKVKEAAQVPTMKTEDLKEVMAAAMTGRYGDNGSQAMFQWITENHPGAVTDDLYIQIQQIMEAGRNEFQNVQTRFIDAKRTYETNLGYVWKGLWLRIAGYPKLNLDDYKIITSEHAKEAFETGVDKGITIQ